MEHIIIEGESTIIEHPKPEGVIELIYSVYDMNLSEYIQYDTVYADPQLDVLLIDLNQDVCKYERSLRIDLQFIYPDNYDEDVLYVTLSRQLATTDEIQEYFTEMGYTSLDNKSVAFIELQEKKARALIKAITNDPFKFEYKSVGAFGADTDLLHLGQRIESFDKITYDDYVVYDSTEDPEIDELGTTLGISLSKYAIRVVAEGVNISEWVDQNPIRNPSYFGKGSSYVVRGEYGWRFIPEDIKIATYELINDMLCNDFIYRNKGLKSVQNDSFTIQFADGMLNGTGNLYVDSLLEPFKIWNLRAI